MRRRTPLFVILALVLAACGGDDDAAVPEIDDADVSEEPAEPDDDAESEPTTDGDAGGDDAGDSSDGDGSDESDGTDEDAGDDVSGASGDDSEGSPTPDEAALEDPCADHDDETFEPFIDLVAPVDDQQVTDELELVGCSSVHEGTIQYRLLDGDGETLDEGFTTASCGGPCVGEFRESVPLDATEGEPAIYVQVFWEDVSDGSERDLVERIVIP